MSKASREGMHLVNEAQSMTERMMDGPVTAPVDTSTAAQGGATAVQFQRKFGGADRMDDEMNMKMQLMDNNGMTPFGQVYYDDRVARWMEKKAATQESANLDAWFNREFNKNNLADRQFAQQLYPEFYAAREQEMMAKAKEALNLKMIQLRGPQSKEDMYKLWLIQTGRVVLPEDWDRIGNAPQLTTMSGAEGQQQQKLFRQGLIRLPKFEGSHVRDQNAAALSQRRLWGSQVAAGPGANLFGSEPPVVAANKNRPLASGPDGTLAANLLSQLRNAY